MRLVRYVINSALEPHGRYVGLAAAIAGSSVIGSALLAFPIALVGIGRPDLTSLSFVPLFALFATVASFPIVAFFGIVLGPPATWLLAGLRLESAISYALAGLAAGSVLLLPGGGPSAMDWIIKSGGMAYGAIGGLLWWELHRRWVVLARRGMADRD